MKPNRKLRVGVTIHIRDGNQSLWENGIFQNCVLLVQLFQSMPEVEKAVLIHGRGVLEIPAGLMLSETKTEIISLDDAMGALDLVIEMSDQPPEDWVSAFRAKGGRYVAMKVGNEYFIDVERAIYLMPNAGLCSRKVYDAIWTLPQYKDCCSDYFSLNTRAPVRIVPHLWSPVFLEMGLARMPEDARFGYQPGQSRWRVCAFEPNLSLVKTSVIPMLVCEEAYRDKPTFPSIFRFCNTFKSKDNAAFIRFAQALDIVKNGLSSFDGRFVYCEFMAHHGDCVVSHQWHNAQNYLYYETLYGGYPLVHNSPIIRDLGYFYPDFDCKAGGKALVRAFETHDANLGEYKAKAKKFLKTLDISYQPNIDAYREEMLDLFSGGKIQISDEIQFNIKSTSNLNEVSKIQLSDDKIEKTSGLHGEFYIAVGDSYVGRSLKNYGEWAEAEVHLFRQIVKPDFFILEAGSNIGSHTIPLSRICSKGKIYAFEPQPFIFSILRKNIELNCCKNVFAWNVALGAERGKSMLPMLLPDKEKPVNFGAASIFDPSHSGSIRKTISIPLLSIDEINEIKKLDFIKTDTEGYDYLVLMGASEKIKKYRPFVFVESVTHHGDISEKINAFFSELGYSTWHYNTHIFNPENHKNNKENIFGRMASFDMLCIPEEKARVEGLAKGTDPVPMLPAENYPDDYWKKTKFIHLK